MIRINFEPIRNWFGYSRRERRSSFILLTLIVLLQGIGFVTPDKKLTTEVIPVDQSIVFFDPKPVIRSEGPANNIQEVVPVRRQRPLTELNTCDSASLEALPGIGPVLSARIIKYRNLLGGFATVDQLGEVYGLNEETFRMISGKLRVDTTLIKRISINTADYKRLIKLPYFEKQEVSSILRYRDLNGRITGMNDLIKNNLINPESVVRIRPYLDFGE